MVVAEADFGGYATKADTVCADGLTITAEAFKHQDGLTVPLVYNHGHTDIENILGHGILEARPDGIYINGYFNDSEKGKLAKEAVRHGDITQLSIFANQLTKAAKSVLHGLIREVSLVPAGANPGALIDFVSIKHGLEEYESDEDAIIYNDSALEIKHSATDTLDEEASLEEVWNSLTEQQKEAMGQILEHAGLNPDASEEPKPGDNPEEVPPVDPSTQEPNTDKSDPDPDKPEPTDGDPAPASDDAINHNDLEGNNVNVFDAKAKGKLDPDDPRVISHSTFGEILGKAKNGEMKLSEALDSYQNANEISHGIGEIDLMFPDAKQVTDRPDWIQRRTEWVSQVLAGAKKQPFARVKTMLADLTPDSARAKGYIKGNYKKEQFFKVAKRVTLPKTIYKKQKLDREDIVDITSFDVVLWIKDEMRGQLDEELARAILLGDGREADDDDKIDEDHIRPIATDDELYQTTIRVKLDDTDASSPEKIVDTLLLQRRHYKGSGNPVFFTTEDIIARILNVKDTTGRRIYSGIGELATVLRVASLVPVEVMETDTDIVGIMVNMQDYTIGADKGGEVTTFDDFDIDYNQYKYLIETRCSGALTKYKSAIVLRRAGVNQTQVKPVAPTWDPSTHRVTVPEVTGLTYKNKGTGATLQKSSPVTLASGQELDVIAVPSGPNYYIESTSEDEFRYTYEDGRTQGVL